ncbi:MAG: agmatinase [Ardenticatenaceae bacterium]|nr:agmatinase [Ardenticatenaceae bacterium]
MNNFQARCNQLQPNMVAIVGVPSDENSSFLRGPAQAPGQIRQVLHSGSSNLCAENGHDLGQEPRLLDVGDMPLGPGTWQADGSPTITGHIASLLEKDARVLSLGGDHAVTFPIVQAFAAKYPDLTILHIDAHSDLYDEFEGSRVSHACPFARIMEAGHAKRLVQVGIRTLNAHQRAQAEKFGVEIIQMADWQPGMALNLTGPLYLSLDLDGLDPAFAPGVSHHEPGGLTTREVIDLIQAIDVPLVGADIVELNPVRDLVGMTTAVAAKLLMEIVVKLL